ncbi:MAG: ATP-grasp domain-containing protein [Solirubrobacterales bacterium]
MRALIVEDGLSRQALAAARALAADGWGVGIGSPTASSVAAASRSVAAWHRVGALSDGLDEFADDVSAAVSAGKYDLVFGARDEDVAALAAIREGIDATVAHPELERIARAQDKLVLMQLGAAAGFSVPRTDAAEDGISERVAAGATLLVKPGVGRAAGTALASKTAPPRRIDACEVNTPQELGEAVAAIEACGDDAVVQERIEGDLLALVVLVDRAGTVVRSFTQLAEKTWPLGTGISVRARVIEPDRTLSDHAAKLVAELGWSGIAQLQFVVPQDEEPRLIDFNGRFYGSLALAAAAGCNISAAWARGVLSGSTPDPGEARVGTRYHWAWGDLRRATQERNGGLTRDIVSVPRFARGAAHSVFDRRDLRPGLRYLRRVAGRSGRRRLQPGGPPE